MTDDHYQALSLAPGLKLEHAQRDPPDLLVLVSEETMEEVDWYLRVNVGFSKLVVCPTPNIQIFTDACTTRWRVHMQYTVIKGTWIPEEATYRDEGCQTVPAEHQSKALDTYSGLHRQHLDYGICQPSRGVGTRSWSVWKGTVLLF